MGEKNGVLKFSDGKSDVKNHISSSGDISVNVKKLDEFDFPSTIALIKIDVEGYEKFVLIGGAVTLSKVKCIIYESSEHQYSRYNYKTTDIINILQDQGFNIFKKHNKTIYPIATGYTSEKVENIIAVRDIDDFIIRTGYTVKIA